MFSKDTDKGHYVFIVKDNFNGTCNVNVITSLENDKHEFDFKKLKQVKKGNTYSLPKYDTEFTKWSGVNHGVIKNVNISDIKNIGCKRIRRRHFYYIHKFMQ